MHIEETWSSSEDGEVLMQVLADSQARKLENLTIIGENSWF